VLTYRAFLGEILSTATVTPAPVVVVAGKTTAAIKVVTAPTPTKTWTIIALATLVKTTKTFTTTMVSTFPNLDVSCGVFGLTFLCVYRLLRLLRRLLLLPRVVRLLVVCCSRCDAFSTSTRPQVLGIDDCLLVGFWDSWQRLRLTFRTLLEWWKIGFSHFSVLEYGNISEVLNCIVNFFFQFLVKRERFEFNNIRCVGCLNV
jgi:hypothetical protein